MSGNQDALGRKSRRKACDLCFKKKIKCDRTKPRCSHCKVYQEAQCTFTPLTRVSNPKPPSSARVDTLEARLRELEARLKEFEDAASSDLSSGRPFSTDEDRFIPSNPTSSLASQGAISSTLSAASIRGVSGGQDNTQDEHAGHGYFLPPLHEVLPLVSQFFATTNRVMPLFHEATTIRMLRNWYFTPVSQQDPAVWGVLNVVLALSRRHLYLDISSPRGTLDVYVRNAQSVMNCLVTRDEDLLGVQAVLGLAMIFYGTSDPKPATVLLATACRLAYALRLNTREFRNRGNELVHVDKGEMLQRQRVFWVLYINDRDISMRINQPALLNEADIDVDLPAENPEDGVGILHSSSGVQLNFFRKRVQFAWIEGKVHEWLFSIRAEKLPADMKEENIRRLERALDQWEESLPDEFGPDMLNRITDVTTFQAVMGLHFTHLQTLAIIHRSYSYNASWLEALRRYSGKEMNEVAIEELRAMLPTGWTRLVERARSCLGLFMFLPEHHLYLVWMSCCAFFSSLIFLAVNTIIDAHHHFLEQDQQLVAFGLKVVTRLAAETENERLKLMLGACSELDAKARVVVERARRLEKPYTALRSSEFDQEGSMLSRVTSLFSLGNDEVTAERNVEFGPMLTGFGNEVQAQPSNFGLQLRLPAPALERNPDFDGVLKEMTRQRWF